MFIQMEGLEHCFIFHYLIMADFNNQLTNFLKLYHLAHASKGKLAPAYVWVTPRPSVRQMADICCVSHSSLVRQCH